MWERSVGPCLSIVKLSRHHSVVGRSLIHRSEPLTWPCATISVTLGAFLNQLVRPIRERIWRSTRVGAVGWPVFEHREAVPTPLGGGTIAHSPIRTAHLAPCHDIRYSRCLPVNQLVRPIQERIWRSTRVGAVGWPVFEHREAVPTPLGGGTIAHSLISAPQPTS